MYIYRHTYWVWYTHTHIYIVYRYTVYMNMRRYCWGYKPHDSQIVWVSAPNFCGQYMTLEVSRSWVRVLPPNIKGF